MARILPALLLAQYGVTISTFDSHASILQSSSCIIARHPSLMFYHYKMRLLINLSRISLSQSAMLTCRSPNCDSFQTIAWYFCFCQSIPRPPRLLHAIRPRLDLWIHRPANRVSASPYFFCASWCDVLVRSSRNLDSSRSHRTSSSSAPCSRR